MVVICFVINIGIWIFLVSYLEIVGDTFCIGHYRGAVDPPTSRDDLGGVNVWRSLRTCYHSYKTGCNHLSSKVVPGNGNTTSDAVFFMQDQETPAQHSSCIEGYDSRYA